MESSDSAATVALDEFCRDAGAGVAEVLRLREAELLAAMEGVLKYSVLKQARVLTQWRACRSKQRSETDSAVPPDHECGSKRPRSESSATDEEDRVLPYQKRFGFLSQSEVAAAKSLGIRHMNAWEKEMPTPGKGIFRFSVVRFQSRSWNSLTTEQCAAAESLGLSKEIWQRWMANVLPIPSPNFTGEWGWKEFKGIPGVRSCPGYPPRERRYPYQHPYDELGPTEIIAAGALGFDCAEVWELSLPRRMQGCSSVTLRFHRCHWKGLSSNQKDAASLLGITQKVWDLNLSLFHDRAWQVPGISMDDTTFCSCLRGLHRMTKNPLQPSYVVQFLLGLERVLTPSQGLKICEVLQAGPCWETLGDALSGYFNIHVLVASFLSDPLRFVQLYHAQINIFWNDESGGCAWGNAFDSPSSSRTYSEELRHRHNIREGKVWAGLVVTGKLPTGGAPELPPLPVHLVRVILDDWVGKNDEFDPNSVSWICSNNHGYGRKSVLSFLGA